MFDAEFVFSLSLRGNSRLEDDQYHLVGKGLAPPLLRGRAWTWVAKATTGYTLGLFLMALVCARDSVDLSVRLVFLLDSSVSLAKWAGLNLAESYAMASLAFPSGTVFFACLLDFLFLTLCLSRGVAFSIVYALAGLPSRQFSSTSANVMSILEVPVSMPCPLSVE